MIQLIPDVKSPETVRDLAFIRDRYTDRLAGKEPVTIWKGSPIYSFGDDYNGFYFLRDESTDEVVYYMKYKRVRGSGLKSGRQVMVYAKYQDYLASGAAKEIFWNHILPRFDSMISDRLQTRHGQQFWLNRVTEALKSNIPVYLPQRSSPGPALTQITSDRQMRELLPTIWGSEPRFGYVFLMISLSPLTLKSKANNETPSI